MASDDDDDPKPEQIPLLVEVVPSEPPPPWAPAGGETENLALDLDPDPPKTSDLFIDQLEDAIDSPMGADLLDSSLDLGFSEQNDSGSEPAPMDDPEAPGTEFSDRMSAQFRVQANELVDNLVREYSDEILKRLRGDLMALLRELDTDPQDPE